MSGWIALHRGWRDNDVFADDVMSEREAWVWLIESAAWKDTVRRNAKRERIDVRRGQFHTSLRTLGTVFGWGKNKVARYLDRLVLAEMVGTVAGQSGLLITICNYDKYQSVTESKEAMLGTVAGQSRDTQEQGKHLSASNEAGVPPVDTVKAIFDLGVTLLTASGHDERASRSIVGRWRKEYGDPRVLEALLDPVTKTKSDPVSWMPRRMGTAPANALSDLAEQSSRYRDVRRAA